MSRTIQFTVESDRKKEEIREIAEVRGFPNAGSLARFALYQYISRYPLKDATHAQDEHEREV